MLDCIRLIGCVGSFAFLLFLCELGGGGGNYGLYFVTVAAVTIVFMCFGLDG